MSLSCLEQDEIRHITGFRQKSRQAAWLKKEKVAFKVNALGHPIVGRAYWDRLCGEPKRRNNSGPNWGAQGD